MGTPIKKVLVIEDGEFLQGYWQDVLDGRVEIICAFSIEEAERRFVANPDIVAIVMDACVPGTQLNTESLVQKFRATFAGPMIAISSIPEYRQKLVLAGCDFECDKESVSHKLCEILGL